MPLIEFRQASKSYGRETPVHALRSVDLTVEAGEYVAVVGKSGSGKTTLLNLVAGLDSATSGEVIVEGENVGKLGENARARWRSRSLGIVFQFFQLLPSISVLDNILLAMSINPHTPGAGAADRARALLASVGLEEMSGRLPGTLSGGQQQRAAIARALANDPTLLILDEPTGSIDSEATADLLDLLGALHGRGRTLLVVTHDDDVAAHARRRITLRDGRIASDEGAAA